MKRLFSRLFLSLIILSAFALPFVREAEPAKASSTVTFYSDVVLDGDVTYTGANYTTANNAVNATSASSVNQYSGIGQRLDGTGNYTIGRAFEVFDTSSLPDTAIVSGVKLYAKGWFDLFHTDTAIVIQTSNNTYPEVTGVDITIYDKNLYGDNFSSVNTTSFSTTSFMEFDLSDAGIATVNVTGDTKFTLRTENDINGVAPTGNETCAIWNGRAAAPDRPYLVVEYLSDEDIVETNDATNILPTTATLQGELLSTANQSYVGVYFEYGSSTSYGTTTIVQNVTTTGTFSQDIIYLQYNQTYHFRAIAKMGGAVYYGQDFYFTTMPAVGSTTDMRIVSVAVFSEYIVTGDLLFCAEVINNYTGLYPNADPKQYFTIQLLDTNGIDVLGATPLQNWGDRPVSVYISNAENFTDLGGYYIRMIENPASGTSSVFEQLEIGEWYGYDLVALDGWCRGVATNMQVSDGRSDYLTGLTDIGSQITDAAGGYFSTGIPAITTVRPKLFTTSQRVSLAETGTANNAWDRTDADPTGWRSYVGANIAGDIDDIALPFGLDGKEIAFGLVMFAMFGVVISVVGATGGWGALGALLIAIPILWVGVWFRIVPIWILTIIVIGFGYFFVRQFHWKTL